MKILRFGRWFHGVFALLWCLLLIDTIMSDEGKAAVARAVACTVMFSLFFLGTLQILHRHRQEAETMHPGR
ncbi:hypothetical protein [Streptomyces solaniscabiei]|uniref:hypothetical protein n=1 Tax=Streptomyces solaniscabiei TaxID=2683255 RepID=UPI001CE3B267|nr:hypothetical protein [Streptomyces solaniscabiei]